MFTWLHFENYKSFRELDLNLQSGDKPKKMVAIYGENGAGKSNVVSAFTNLRQSIDTVNGQKMLAQMQKELVEAKDNEKIDQNFGLVRQLFSEGRVSSATLNEIFKGARTVGSIGPMKIRYDFNIDGKKGYYELVFESGNEGMYLASESLNYLIKKATGKLYHITGDEDGNISINFSPSLFTKKPFTDLITDSVYRLWGKHTFLAILNNISADSNPQYLKDNILRGLLKVLTSFRRLAFRDDHNSGQNSFKKLLRDFNQGTISDDKQNLMQIETTERVLNKYFVPLYSDIMHMFYRITSKGVDKKEYELFEKKRVGGQLIEIPFRFESHGTRQLLALLPLFLNAVYGETVVIDEMDRGIHDLLIDRLIDNLKEDIQGQLIFTTHDTQVMKQLSLANVYVIQSDSDGNKQVVSLANSGKAIAVNNNVQKLYLEGYFSGIPYADDVDFYDILQDLRVK